MSFSSSLYLWFFVAISVIQAALVVPRATSTSACSTTKTVTTVVTSTPVFTHTVEKTKTAKNAVTYTDLYYTTVATATTTPTVTVVTTSTCTPTGCDCTTSCYPGCLEPRKRDVNAIGADTCTITSTNTVTAKTTSTVTTTTTFTFTNYVGVSANSAITATPTHTVFVTTTAIGYSGIPNYDGDYIQDGQTFYGFDFAYFGNTLYEGSLLTCGCNAYNNDGEPGDPCVYANVTYNCGSYYDCVGICAQINTAHGARTCLGAVYGGHEYFECYLNNRYPVKYGGRCGLSEIDDNTYETGLLDGYESRSG